MERNCDPFFLQSDVRDGGALDDTEVVAADDSSSRLDVDAEAAEHAAKGLGFLDGVAQGHEFGLAGGSGDGALAAGVPGDRGAADVAKETGDGAASDAVVGVVGVPRRCSFRGVA